MTLDTTLQKILQELEPENHLGIFMLAQMGGVPQEVQMIIQTAQFNEATKQLKPIGQYIIRAIGVGEQKLALGIFNAAVLSTDHPVLYHFNEKLVQVYFRGQPENVDVLMLELQQLYDQTYLQKRSMVDDINRSRPLGILLSSGHGMLGQMPLPFAEKVKTLLARYDLTCNFVDVEDEHHHDHGDHGHEHPAIKYQLLAMDDSYIIAQLFSADPMGKQA